MRFVVKVRVNVNFPWKVVFVSSQLGLVLGCVGEKYAHSAEAAFPWGLTRMAPPRGPHLMHPRGLQVPLVHPRGALALWDGRRWRDWDRLSLGCGPVSALCSHRRL